MNFWFHFKLKIDLLFHDYFGTTSFHNLPQHAFTFYKLHPKYKNNHFLSCGPRLSLHSQDCVIVLGEVEGCPPHHPASVPGRMDVSMWRGVSTRLLTVKVSQSGTALPSTGQCAAQTSPVQSSLVGLIQKGCVNVKVWVREKRKVEGEEPGESPPLSLLLCADTRWTLTNIHTETKRSLFTRHQRVFFDVRIKIFKMSLGSWMAASAMGALQQGASEASSSCQSVETNAQSVWHSFTGLQLLRWVTQLWKLRIPFNANEGEA